MKRKLLLILLLVASMMGAGCGSRLPSPETAQKVIHKHFKKYGKKYKDSDFGRHPIARVEVTEIDELQKDLAAADGFAYLSSGGPVYRIRVTLQKKTFGWRHIQWENLGTR